MLFEEIEEHFRTIKDAIDDALEEIPLHKQHSILDLIRDHVSNCELDVSSRLGNEDDSDIGGEA